MIYGSSGGNGEVEPRLYLQMHAMIYRSCIVNEGPGLLGRIDSAWDVGGITSMMRGAI
jgi:hypothetical protein